MEADFSPGARPRRECNRLNTMGTSNSVQKSLRLVRRLLFPSTYSLSARYFLQRVHHYGRSTSSQRGVPHDVASEGQPLRGCSEHDLARGSICTIRLLFRIPGLLTLF